MNNFWQQKQVLVTGAGGFIGSHLVERLAWLGAAVRAFVRYNSRGDAGLLRLLSLETMKKVEIIPGDLRDEQAIQSAVAGCEHVFHLGALISIPYSYLHNEEVVATNILGTLNILNACHRFKVTRVIHTSTSEVYGTARYAPIDEAHPLHGQSPYSASKIGADKLAESFYCAYGLPVVTVRPFNTYGPRQSARAVIPTIITQALKHHTIRLGNLEASRDFTFVDDTVSGFLLAAETNQIAGRLFNLGTGCEIKIGELAHRIIAMLGEQLTVELEVERLRPVDSEVFRLISDNKLARESLGWIPQTGLDQGLEKTIEWVRNHLELYQTDRYIF